MMISKLGFVVGVLLLVCLLPFSSADTAVVVAGIDKCGYIYGSWKCSDYFGQMGTTTCDAGGCSEEYACDTLLAYYQASLPDTEHDTFLPRMVLGEEYFNLDDARIHHIDFVVCARLDPCNTQCEQIGMFFQCTKIPWLSLPLGGLAVTGSGALCPDPPVVVPPAPPSGGQIALIP